MAPRSDSSVLTTFSSNGWSSPGVASLVGISAAIGDVIGADSSVHLAEELKNASWILPRSMMATAMMNYVLGFITISVAVRLLIPRTRFSDFKQSHWCSASATWTAQSTPQLGSHTSKFSSVLRDHPVLPSLWSPSCWSY